jgi:hypothetical protein
VDAGGGCVKARWGGGGGLKVKCLLFLCLQWLGKAYGIIFALMQAHGSTVTGLGHVTWAH